MFSGNLKFSDDDDFSFDVENYSTRTNLSSIFGLQKSSQNSSSNHKNENTTLKHVPSSKSNSTIIEKHQQEQQNSKKPSEWSIQTAKVVSAFKLINQENISQGKLGLTVLKNPDGLRKIILYRTKTNILSTTTIIDNSKFYIKNSYLQFRDDLQEFWSVLFDQKNDFTIVRELIEDKIVVEEEQRQDTKDKELLAKTTVETDIEVEQNKIQNENVQKSVENKERNSKNSDIISRMAKMGGQALPQLVTPGAAATSTTTDQSDSSDNEIRKSSKPLVPLRKPKSSPQLVSFSHSQHTISPMLNTINTMASYSSSATSLLPQANADVNFVNMLMTENRTQNAEIRMNMSKLETKIEKVLDKIDLIQWHGANNGNSNDKDGKHKEDLILELEEKLLEYKKDNRKLKLQLEEQEENNKKYERKENNSKSPKEEDFIEFKKLIQTLDINIMDYNTSDEAYKEIIRKLENNYSSLVKLSSEQGVKIAEFTNELENLKMQTVEQQKFIEQNNALQSNIEELQKTISSLEKNNNELRTENNGIQEKLKNLTCDNENLKKDKSELENKMERTQQESVKIIDNVVKDIMNNLYQTIVNKFDVTTNKTFKTDEILKICATSIKQETKNAVQRINSKNNSGSSN